MKIQNVFAKFSLTLLGFALSTGQCLAQYMAIVPRERTVHGHLTGISDTIRNFKVILNRDTLNASWLNNYKFEFKYRFIGKENVDVEIEIPEKTNYLPMEKIITIRPEDEEIEIKLKKKHKK